MSFVVVVWLFVSISNVHVLCSSSPNSPKDRPLPNTLSDLLSTVETDGIIYGNPLLYPECANALISDHDMYQLTNNSLVLPWFWSRETLSASQQHRALHRRSKIQSPHNPTAVYPIITSQQLTKVADSRLIADHLNKFLHRRVLPPPNVNYKVRSYYTDGGSTIPLNNIYQPYMDTYDHVTVYGIDNIDRSPNYRFNSNDNSKSNNLNIRSFLDTKKYTNKEINQFYQRDFINYINSESQP